jgi:signal transduction histidine kinase
VQFRAIWRTTTFRLTALYGLLFALGTLALLGMVYVQSAVFLTQRVDGILETEAQGLAHSPRADLRRRLLEELALNGDQTNIFALFAADGTPIAGNLAGIPPALRANGPPLEVPPSARFRASARLIARRLPSGELLVVGRDVNQLREMRRIIAAALIWSGVFILLVGLACGLVLSIPPLRRLRILQATAQDIAYGNLERRMPTSHRRDELDMFAVTVNQMMEQVERLMSEIKGATEAIAHDLLTPLSRATVQLRRIQLEPRVDPEEVAHVTGELNEMLDRFRAILRIAELDARHRRAGFARVDLAEVIAPIVDLYGPLAEAGGVRLLRTGERGAFIEADAKLLFEAVCNLVDNAIKFSGQGSVVQVRLGDDQTAPRIIVEDNGPGIPADKRAMVLQRFYRGDRNAHIPGSGLGLSVVAAIVRLHGFELIFEDANPGVRAVIDCRVKTVAGVPGVESPALVRG